MPVFFGPCTGFRTAVRFRFLSLSVASFMHRAELVLALIMGLVSAGLMWKSAELPVGWIPEEGPGGGAFPFWLSAGMLACCIWILVRWVRQPGGGAKADARPYFEGGARTQVIMVTAALAVMVGLVHVIGVYGSIPLFLVFYVRLLGRHSWTLTAAIAVLTPVVTFFFFEAALKITLPKGYTEPLFYPLYDWFL